MDQDGRPRKDTAKQSARKRPAVKVAARGKLKGRPVAGAPRTDAAKLPLSAARRAGRPAERIVGGRDELPPPIRRLAEVAEDERSLRLRLLVEGKRITMLDAQEVEAPGTLPGELRGTNFIEVRSGGEVLAAQALVDPGIAVGIPDPADKKEFRGHRFIELPSYEIVIRVPLGPLRDLIDRHSQGRGEGSRRRSLPAIEIDLYQAKTHLVFDPRRDGPLAQAQRGKVSRLAQSGEIALDEVRGAGGRTQKPRSDRQP